MPTFRSAGAQPTLTLLVLTTECAYMNKQSFLLHMCGDPFRISELSLAFISTQYFNLAVVKDHKGKHTNTVSVGKQKFGSCMPICSYHSSTFHHFAVLLSLLC